MKESIIERVEYEGLVYKSVRRRIRVNNKILTRDLIVKPECVVGLVKYIADDDYELVVLVKEFRVGSMNHEYGFPAGFIDDGETPMQAMSREIREETGFTPIRIEALGSAYTSSGFTDEKIHYFYVEISGKPEDQILDEDEDIEVVTESFEVLGMLFEDGSLNGNHSHTAYLKYLIHKGVI